jgi:hypothetical protein
MHKIKSNIDTAEFLLCDTVQRVRRKATGTAEDAAIQCANQTALKIKA